MAKDMWNGGKTFGHDVSNKYNEMLRESEDYHDTIDSELTDRESLATRQKIMNKTRLPHDKTPKVMKVSGMGGRQMKDSDRFNKVKK